MWPVSILKIALSQIIMIIKVRCGDVTTYIDYTVNWISILNSAVSISITADFIANIKLICVHLKWG